MLNNNKFTFVNVCFQHKRNEEIGLYGQTLIKQSVGKTNLQIVDSQFDSAHYDSQAERSRSLIINHYKIIPPIG